MIALGIVGCGDVAFRTYLPGLALLQDRTRITACFDPDRARAERLAAAVGGATLYTDYAALLGHPGLNGILNLTPAPFHREISSQALDAGLHVYSEKPLAADIAQSQALIEQARQRDRLLLCAPAVMATSRFRWLRQEFGGGRFGRPTLAVGQMANLGPAAWKAYKGDPAVFYSKQVGPLLDLGVYILHAVTGMLGPAKRVEAFGGIAMPRREVLIPERAGQVVTVEANDHMLLHLDFGNTSFAQVMSSFAVPRSLAPALEIHGTNGSVSIPMDRWYPVDAPIPTYVGGETGRGPNDWVEMASPVPSRVPNLIQAGADHFVACLLGEEAPILTAEHACHVLEIIIAADRSVREGRAIDLETTF